MITVIKILVKTRFILLLLLPLSCGEYPFFRIIDITQNKVCAVSQLQNVRRNFADNGEWLQVKVKSRSRKNCSAKQENEKFWGPTRKRGGNLNYNWSKES